MVLRSSGCAPRGAASNIPSRLATHRHMPTCPICRTEADAMLHATPYRACAACGTGFQSPSPLPSHEVDRDFPKSPMSANDREVNRQLAHWLLANALGGKPG